MADQYRPFDVGGEQEIIPTGGDFVPTGFVAPWSAARVQVIRTQSDMANEVGAALVRPQGTSGWNRLYFNDYQAAATAAKTLGEQFINQVWRFQTNVTDVINMRDASVFQDPVLAYDVDVTTLESKRKYAYHLIALPSAVAAVAKSYGFKNTGFDLSELLSDSTIFDDNFQFQMIGNPGAKDSDPDHWSKSVLWQRRAALWASLGEPTPFPYIEASAPKGQKKYMATEGGNLEACLHPICRRWQKQQWARLVQVFDPRVDAVIASSGNRLKIACITEMFYDKDDAVKAVEAEAGGNVPEAAAPTKATPKLPEAWAELGTEEWVSELKKQMASGVALPVMAKNLGVSVGDINAWKAVV